MYYCGLRVCSISYHFLTEVILQLRKWNFSDTLPGVDYYRRVINIGQTHTKSRSRMISLEILSPLGLFFSVLWQINVISKMNFSNYFGVHSNQCFTSVRLLKSILDPSYRWEHPRGGEGCGRGGSPPQRAKRVYYINNRRRSSKGLGWGLKRVCTTRGKH